jgi:hypothetical protein
MRDSVFGGQLRNWLSAAIRAVTAVIIAAICVKIPGRVCHHPRGLFLSVTGSSPGIFGPSYLLAKRRWIALRDRKHN